MSLKKNRTAHNDFPFLLEEDILRRAKSSGCTFLVIKSALVGSGEFIKHSDDMIGQTIRTDERRDTDKDELSLSVEMNNSGNDNPRDRFVLIRKLEFSAAVRDPYKYYNVAKTTIELVRTGEVVWVPSDAVSGIAFVFHFDDVQEGKFLIAGMDNAYCIRRLKDASNNAFYDIKCKEWDPWWSPFGEEHESYSKRIYNFLAALNDAVFRALSFQGKCGGRNKPVNMDGWPKEINSCLTSDLGSGVIRKIDTPRNASRKRQLPNLAVCKKRMKATSDTVRCLTHDALADVRKKLGSTFGVAADLAVPTISEQEASKDPVTKVPKTPDTVFCRDDTQVRILDCDVEDLEYKCEASKTPFWKTAPDEVFSGESSQMKEEEREKMHPLLYKTPCPYGGMDIECRKSKFGIVTLHLNVKFKKVRAIDKAVERARFGGDKHDNPNLATATTEAEATVERGSKHCMLVKDNEAYNITSTGNGRVQTKSAIYGLSDSEGSTHSMDEEEASRLVGDYSRK